jgi:chromosome partitioning protein
MMTFIEAKKQGVAGPTPHILFNSTSRTEISQEEKQIRANDKYKAYCFQNTLKKYRAFTELDEGKGFVWGNKKAYSIEAWSNISSVTREFLARTEVLP